jgi:hypothetical protein
MENLIYLQNLFRVDPMYFHWILLSYRNDCHSINVLIYDHYYMMMIRNVSDVDDLYLNLSMDDYSNHHYLILYPK